MPCVRCGYSYCTDYCGSVVCGLSLWGLSPQPSALARLIPSRLGRSVRSPIAAKPSLLRTPNYGDLTRLLCRTVTSYTCAACDLHMRPVRTDATVGSLRSTHSPTHCFHCFHAALATQFDSRSFFTAHLDMHFHMLLLTLSSARRTEPGPSLHRSRHSARRTMMHD